MEFHLGTVLWFASVALPTAVAVLWQRSTARALAQMRSEKAKHDEAEALLQTIFENAPDFLCFKDRDSRYMHFSKAYLTYFGLSDVAMLRGKTDFDIFDHELSRMAREDELRIMETGVPLVCKVERSPRSDGGVTWFLTTKLPWRDGTGAIVGIFVITKEISALKEAEQKLESLNRKLMDTSRQAGMAEVATGVLHNVGNVLNSVNVSATLVTDRLRHSKLGNVGRVCELLRAHEADLAAFLAVDPKGKMTIPYLEKLTETLVAEHASIASELEGLQGNIEHIKDIVAMQQSYAKTSGVAETVSIPDLIEDALRMNAGSLARHHVDIIREYQDRSLITVEKHKVLQVLVNLLRNAKYACDESVRPDKQIRLRTSADDGCTCIEVIDNGIGIARENLTRIFAHGFTTKKDGHGFGLHSGALAAMEMGGTLTAHSEGPGKGATFILKLPYKSDAVTYETPSA
jgi:PAS domain S-box-containing protein